MTVPSVLPPLTLRSLDATWNRARWALLPDDGNRYEVIDGVLFISTAPSPFHQWIVRQVFLALYRQIDEAGVGVTLWSPIGVFMPGCDPVQPDLLVVAAADTHIIGPKHIEGVPALLIEVLSPGNPTTDTDTKRRAYARAGVAEYWIVRPATSDVLLYAAPDATLGDYTSSVRVPSGAELVSPTLPVRVAVTRFFADAPGAAAQESAIT